MAYVGSDVLEVTYNNPIVGQGSFQCKAGEGSNISLGGISSGDDKGMVTGSGTRINQQTMNCSNFELPPIAWDKTGKDELAKLAELQSCTVGSVVTVSFVDGNIYQMQNAYPVGDLVGDGYAGTIACTFQGDAKASKIS